MLNRVSTASSATDKAQRGAGLIERARGLVPLIAGATDRIDRDRVIPADVLDAMHAARLFRTLIPASIDGEEVEPATFFHVIEAVAMADASVAWCLCQNSGVSMGAAYLDPKVAHELFGDARAAVATGAPSPQARAIVTDGGYRVTGLWHFASGSRHSQWIGGHATICEPDGSPRLGPNGKPLEQRTMLFPKSQATITDTWQVIGLRGTGSDDYAVNDLFVPAAYSFTRESDADRREGGPLYKFSIFNLFGMGFCAVALGIARTVLTDFIAVAKSKKAHSSGKLLADNNLVQTQVGLCQARLGAARAYVLEGYAELYEQAERGEKVSFAQRLASRGMTCFAIQQAREVVDYAYHAAGAGAIFDKNPFERRFRDLHTVTQQSQAHAENFEALGQSLLGIEPARKL
ncbi:MAG TPA: acyl-CoA dehydrogenase family protein [Xanthobacteraceae bacterium]|nr:acyl-CoA dehydrogenase family protein [Xanthobacteraceae bacterium]